MRPGSSGWLSGLVALLRMPLLIMPLLIMAGCSQDAEKTPAGDVPAPTGASSTGSPVPIGEGFDFYVLALSWSPSYCEAEGEDANRQQCKAGRPYAFVVHGLWPQFERGFPDSCPTRSRDVSRETVRSLHDIMPSSGLIHHQWRKHGSCSGLGQPDYFAVLRAARETVSIPARFRHLGKTLTLAPGEAEAAFLEANPALRADAVAVTCDGHYLREVRICMTRDLKFRSCPEIDRRGCRRGRVVMPPTKGG